MIYNNQNLILDESGIFIPGIPIVQNIEINKALERINRSINDVEEGLIELCIPRDHARLESTTRVSIENAKLVDHYTIYIPKQVGSMRNRQDSFLICQFPGSDRKFGIYLYAEGGVNFIKYEHKYMLRITDELDRRIVLGFALKYQHQLKSACYDQSELTIRYLSLMAADYTHKMMPIRIQHKRGDFISPDYKDREPFEEDTTSIITIDPSLIGTIFESVHLI